MRVKRKANAQQSCTVKCSKEWERKVKEWRKRRQRKGPPPSYAVSSTLSNFKLMLCFKPSN